jgi:hypothetical protein
MADRQEWEQVTARSRQLAIAADAELRRRHPDRKIEPLRSAEPALVSHTEREQLQPVLDTVLAEPADRIRDRAAEHQAFRAKLDERQRLVMPSEDLDWDGLGEALPSWRASRRDPILQPPKPQIMPSARILQLTAEPDAEPEAADLRRWYKHCDGRLTRIRRSSGANWMDQGPLPYDGVRCWTPDGATNLLTLADPRLEHCYATRRDAGCMLRMLSERTACQLESDWSGTS